LNIRLVDFDVRGVGLKSVFWSWASLFLFSIISLVLFVVLVKFMKGQFSVEELFDEVSFISSIIPLFILSIGLCGIIFYRDGSGRKYGFIVTGFLLLVLMSVYASYVFNIAVENPKNQLEMVPMINNFYLIVAAAIGGNAIWAGVTTKD